MTTTTETIEHTPTFGPVNLWTHRTDSASCSCGWSWVRKSSCVGGSQSIWERHVRLSKQAS